MVCWISIIPTALAQQALASAGADSIVGGEAQLKGTGALVHGQQIDGELSSGTLPVTVLNSGEYVWSV